MSSPYLETVRAAVHQRLSEVHWDVAHREVGTVIQAGDGVAHLAGLPSVRYGELVERPDGLSALVFDVSLSRVGVLFLDPAEHVRAGDEFYPTGRVASVPVGDEFLGRVVDALGRPVDGGPAIRTQEFWPVEREAPGVSDRIQVHEPMHTGTKVIDTLLPIGRGQRELLIGDRATGKTTIALDAILAQRPNDVLCVYTSIGQPTSSLVEVVETLKSRGALERSVIVAADADAPAGQQYLSPYSAATIAERFALSGRHVLVIYDDLTKHADSYRRVALLFGRSPGREAYPPDVFYLHARLLERATRLHDRLGGGSITALPIADTQAGNISAYIPTNLISITDGQIVLSARLFNEGVRPAVDVGLSVSRVGGKAQPPALRERAGDMRLLYAQLRELETFAQFGAELEPQTRQRLERARRLREALKQPPMNPLSVLDEVATLTAVKEGYLDAIEPEHVGEWLQRVHERLQDLGEKTAGDMELEGVVTPELADRIETVLRSTSRDA